MNDSLKNYKEEITAKLVAALEAGTVPWRKPWNGTGAPFNAVSGRPYNGINTVVLTMRGLELDAGVDPRWCTYKQASDNGWQVKRGSKGTHVTLWKTLLKDPETEEQTAKTIMLQKLFTVFHASQINGIGKYEPAPLTEIGSNMKAEALLAASKADIRHGGYKACYYPSEDYIQLPEKGNFRSASGYYATALHELIHWTGHKTRLDRNLTGTKASNLYAREELVAELGSMFLSGYVGIPSDEELLKNHASYVSSWLMSMKEDTNFIFKAAADASRAADYVISRKEQTNVSEG